MASASRAARCRLSARKGHSASAEGSWCSAGWLDMQQQAWDRGGIDAHPPEVVHRLSARDDPVEEEHCGAGDGQVPPLVQPYRLPHQPAAADLGHAGSHKQRERQHDLPGRGGGAQCNAVR